MANDEQTPPLDDPQAIEQVRAKEEESADLRIRAARGMGWETSGTAFVCVVMFVRLPIMAWLLGPAAYGQMVLARLLIAVGLPVCALGIWPVIIRERELGKTVESTLFWLNVLVGCLVCAVSFGAWGALSAACLGGTKISLAAVCSVSVLLDSAMGFLRARLRRELRYDALFWANVVSVSLSSVVAIACAALGAGVWSIVAGVLVQSAVNLLLCAAFSGGLPGFALRLVEVRKHLAFGFPVVVQGITSGAASRLHLVLAGTVLSDAMLGLFTLAQSLTEFMWIYFAWSARMVAFTSISRMEASEESAAGKYLTVTKGVLLVAAPFFAVSIAGAGLVEGFLSDEWVGVAPVLQLLCIAGLIRTLVSVQNPAFFTLGSPKSLMTFEFISISIATGLVWFGAQFGVVSAAAGCSLAWMILLCVFMLLLARCGGYGFGALLAGIWKLLIAGAGAGLVAWGLLGVVPMQEWMQAGRWVPLAGLTAMTVVVYGAFLALMALLDLELLKRWFALFNTAFPVLRYLGIGRKKPQDQ